MDIYLRNGKQIKDVKLWAIYTGRVEYEKGGNLHDIPVENIAGILYPDGRMRLISFGKIILPSAGEPPTQPEFPADEEPVFNFGSINLANPVSARAKVTETGKDTVASVKKDTTAKQPVPLKEVFTEKKPPSTPVITELKMDCYSSFMRGKSDAKNREMNEPYLCAGCVPLYPLNIFYAYTTYDPKYIPTNADPRCYREGYEAGRRKIQSENLIYGGIGFWAIVLAVVLIL